MTPCTTCNSLTCSCLCPVCGDTPGHCACAPTNVCAWCGVSVLDGAVHCAVCATPDARAVAFAGAIMLPALRHASKAARFARGTVRAPEEAAAPSVAPTSIDSLYRLIRAPGMLATLVFA